MTSLISLVGLLAIAQQALAFPSIAHSFNSKSHGHKSKRINGILPSFDADAQHFDVSGDHAFLPPGMTTSVGLALASMFSQPTIISLMMELQP